MKKIILALSLVACSMVAIAQTNTIIRYPFGHATKLTPAYAATLTVDVTNSVTYLKPGSLTGNLTLNVTASSELTLGAILYLEVTGSAARTITFATGFTAPVLSVDSAKTHTQYFFYDGSKFKPIAAGVKIN